MTLSWGNIILIFIFVTIWHEAGHIFAAKRLGIPIRRIGIGFGPTLWRLPVSDETEFVLRALPLGMSVGIPGRRDEQGRLRRPITHDIWMAAAGPLASFLMPVLLFGLLRIVPFDTTVKEWIIGIGLLSAILGVLNLLPLPGLDGGHLLILSMARVGWQMSPRQEMQIHKVSMQLMLAVCLISVVLQAWRWLAT